MTKNVKPYKTSDQGLAAFLLVKGLTYLKPIPTADSKRKEFVFIDNDERTELVEIFLTGQQATFSPREYSKALRRLNGDLKR